MRCAQSTGPSRAPVTFRREGINQLSGALVSGEYPISLGATGQSGGRDGLRAACLIPANLPGSPAPVCGYDFPGTIDIIPPVERTWRGRARDIPS